MVMDPTSEELAVSTGASDLEAPGVWNPHPPSGWEPVAEVCRTVRAGLDSLAERTVDAILEEISDYSSSSAVPRSDLFASVFRNVDMMLLGIAERRGPREEELAVRRNLGRRRARQGLPIQSLVGAYHVGYRELWASLVTEAKRAGGMAPGLLLEGSTTVWGWIHAVTTAVTEQYEKEIASRAAADARLRAHFLDLLMEDPGSEECVALARACGFLPDAPFRSIALVPNQSDDELRRRVRDAFDASGLNSVTAVHCDRGRTAIVIVQGVVEPVVRAVISGLAEVVGVGAERDGLAGARMSVLDAERALEVALRRRAACHFEDVWLEAIALANRETIAPVLAKGLEAVATHPHLVKTLQAFASAGLCLAEAARQLHLAPNSLRHHLRRWQQMTGWDPWRLDGMNRSLLAIELAQAPQSPLNEND